MELREFVHAPAVTAAPSATAGDVARLMEHHNVGSVIVVDEHGVVVGIVTDRDLAVRAVAAERGAGTPVTEVMTRNVVTLREDASVFDAATAMASSSCRRLPIVGANRALLGVVALDDLVMLFARQTDNLAQAVAAESATPLFRV